MKVFLFSVRALPYRYQNSSLAGWFPCMIEDNFDYAVSQENSWMPIILLVKTRRAVAMDANFGFSECKILNGWEFIRSARELHSL